MVKFFEYQIKCETHSFFHLWIYHLPFMESWFKTIMCDEVNRNLSQMHPALRSHHSHEITSLNYALRYYHNYIVFCVFFSSSLLLWRQSNIDFYIASNFLRVKHHILALPKCAMSNMMGINSTWLLS